MADLVFSRAPHAGGPVHLVFGADAAPVDPPVTVSVYALLSSDVSISATVALPPLEPVQVAVFALLSSDVSVSAAAVYDVRVRPQLDHRAAARHQTGAAARIASAAPWQVSAPRRETRHMPWQQAQQTVRQITIATETAQAVRPQTTAVWQQAAPTGAQLDANHQRAAPHSTTRADSWQHADRLSIQAAVPLQTGIFIVLHKSSGWQAARPQVRHHTGRSGASLHLRGVQRMAVPWQTGMHPRNGRSVLPLPPVRPPRVPNTNLVFACPPWAGGAVHLVFGHVCTLPAFVSVPVRKAYIVINSIDLRRVAGNISLPAHTFRMSLDADSWTWSWSATLDRAAESLLHPIAGQPVELEAMVNGVPYRLLVGSIGRQTTFLQRRISVQGRGLASVLAAPNAPVSSHLTAADMTAQQLMHQVLTVNGASIGWDIDFGLDDWLVPAGAWSLRATPMDALVDIASAVGGYIQPHPTAASVRVLRRYPVAPWEWGDTVPDVALPQDVTEVENMEWIDKPAYNRVFVGGVGAGVFGPVTRAGTAGDTLAPQVNHALITDAVAHRQRGLAVLADTGRQVHMSLKLPVLPETGLILPGKMVRYTADQQHVGIVRSVSLDWSSPVMRQTIGVECHAA